MPKVILLRSQNSSRVGYRGYVEDFGSISIQKDIRRRRANNIIYILIYIFFDFSLQQQ